MANVSGVKNNLWRRTQSGLYAPDRLNFPINGLVLYLPLWHPELSGAGPIVSKDLNAISCTITGTTWGSQGRTFDGNDVIVCGAAGSISVPQEITLMAWVAATAVPTSATGIIGKSKTGDQFMVAIENALNRFGWNVGANWCWALASPTLNTFYFLVGRGKSGVAGLGDFYINDVLQSDVGVADFTTQDNPMKIGYSDRWGATSYSSVIVGELWVYNRVLDLADCSHTRQATKWRFS